MMVIRIFDDGDGHLEVDQLSGLLAAKPKPPFHVKMIKAIITIVKALADPKGVLQYQILTGCHLDN